MLVFDGHVRNIVNLNYDIYSTFAISSALEVNILLPIFQQPLIWQFLQFPASFAALFACDYFGRRWTAFGFSIAAAVSMFLCSFALGNNVIYCLSYEYCLNFLNFRDTRGFGGDIYGGQVPGDSSGQYHPADGHGGCADCDQGAEQLHPDRFWQFAHPRFLLHRSFGNFATHFTCLDHSVLECARLFIYYFYF